MVDQPDHEERDPLAETANHLAKLPRRLANEFSSASHVDDLSTWTGRRFRIALWSHDGRSALGGIETEVLRACCRPSTSTRSPRHGGLGQVGPKHPRRTGLRVEPLRLTA